MPFSSPALVKRTPSVKCPFSRVAGKSIGLFDLFLLIIASISPLRFAAGIVRSSLAFFHQFDRVRMRHVHDGILFRASAFLIPFLLFKLSYSEVPILEILPRVPRPSLTFRYDSMLLPPESRCVEKIKDYLCLTLTPSFSFSLTLRKCRRTSGERCRSGNSALFCTYLLRPRIHPVLAFVSFPALLRFRNLGWMTQFRRRMSFPYSKVLFLPHSFSCLSLGSFLLSCIVFFQRPIAPGGRGASPGLWTFFSERVFLVGLPYRGFFLVPPWSFSSS